MLKTTVKTISFDGMFHIPVSIELEIEKFVPHIIGNFHGPQGVTTNKDEVKEVARKNGDEKFLIKPTIILPDSRKEGSKTVMKSITAHEGNTICFISEGVKYYTDL